MTKAFGCFELLIVEEEKISEIKFIKSFMLESNEIDSMVKYLFVASFFFFY